MLFGGHEMYRSTRYESKDSFQVKIPWDSNTARGFLTALALTIIVLLFTPVVNLEKAKPRAIPHNTIPIELLNFGDGDGTGRSKGNLTREGEKYKGEEPESELMDAEAAARTRLDRNATSQDLDNASDYIPKNELASNKKIDSTRNGTSNRNIGSREGSIRGTGQGDKGSGKGKGTGFGDIEWGGGGNRTVLVKKVPRFPRGVNKSAEIKIRFTVLADGTVSSMVPLQKADPRLERAAMDALAQWRFNPLGDKEKVMVGVIPLSFRLR